MNGKRMNKIKHCLLAVGMFFAIAGMFAAVASAEEFPLRAKYPMVTPISTEQLAGMFDRAIIVDARNRAEYNVIHMKGAANFLVGKMQEQDLLSLRDKDGQRPIVFYCNGHTCSKSYKATKKALGWGFKNVLCYDSGIFTWAKAQPEKAKFFGEPMTAETVKTSLITKEEFSSTLIEPKEFLEMSETGNYTVIDIRDPNERSQQPFHLSGMKNLTFDNMVRLLEAKHPAVPSSNLLIIDNVGKQVKWLQYYLKRAGATNYYFMKGGIRQLVKDGLHASGSK